MQRTKWIDRTFHFDLPEGWIDNVIERLAGTSIRINELIRSVSDDEAEKRFDGKWSIKEQVGHLCDLEELHEGRIDDFISRKDILRAADMTNLKTSQANHNSRSLETLMHTFIAKRDAFIENLRKLDDETQQFRSQHPRLKVMMRPVDLAYFTSEHDDHHLADIRQLVSQLGK